MEVAEVVLARVAVDLLPTAGALVPGAPKSVGRALQLASTLLLALVREWRWHRLRYSVSPDVILALGALLFPRRVLWRGTPRTRSDRLAGPVLGGGTNFQGPFLCLICQTVIQRPELKYCAVRLADVHAMQIARIEAK